MEFPNFETMTVPQIKTWAKENNIQVPNLRKKELITFLLGSTSQPPRVEITAAEIQEKLVPCYCKDQDWMSHLEEKGWCTVPIPGWSDEHSETFKDAFFTYLESCCSNFNRDDRTTWTPKNLPVLLHGILKSDFGHTPLQWAVREMCCPIFEEIWGVDKKDLLCSFDGGCFLVGTKKPMRGKQWIHCDQPRVFCKENGYDERQCFQGVVTLTPSGPKAGGLVVVEGSHKVWKGYMDRHPQDGLKWGPADIADPELSKLKLVKVCAPEGYMLLWDSRTFHCNTTGKEDRMCLYVSMQPRCRATPKEILRRIKYYEEGKMTGHWCYGDWFKANTLPRTYGKETNRAPEIEIAELNDVTRRLVGYE